MFSQAGQELEWVRSRVAERFPVYETKVTEQAVQFLVNVDATTMEAKFDDLRTELVPKDYIPVLAKQAGEYSVIVQRRPPQRFVGTHVNVILLIATLVTTTIAGALNWGGYDDIDWATPEAFAKGSVFFTLPLLAILGIHEMGHYIVAKRYKVHTSLPFFIPAPVFPLGTFGAMISMRDPIPSRRALIDIGAAGPLLGLVTAIPITLAGLFLWQIDPRPVPPNPGGGLSINLPILYQLLAFFVPIPQDTVLHPTAFAGWVGLFVTALNLLPAGQLDGGHVARALLGDRQRYLSYGAILFMLFLALFFGYEGWFIIAIFILVLGARHPPPLNDLTPLDWRRYILGGLTASVLVLSFAAVPIVTIPPNAEVEFAIPGAPEAPISELNHTVAALSNTTLTFLAINAGNVSTFVNLTLSLVNFPDNLTVSFEAATIGGRSLPIGVGYVAFRFNSSEVANVTLRIDASAYVLGEPDWTFAVRAFVDGEFVPPETAELAVNLRVE